MRLATRLLTFSVLMAGANHPASAKTPSVFINNVKVDGLTDQSFTNVDVSFDSSGDIHITAKGYKISTSDGAAAENAAGASHAQSASGTPGAPPGTVGNDHHFYIATMQPAGRTGMAQWDIDVYVNQVYVKKFRSKDPDPVFEISRFLKPGANVIHFTARKEEGERLSTSTADYVELVVGDGEMRAGQVMLNKITAYRRTAAESGLFNSEATINLANAP